MSASQAPHSAQPASPVLLSVAAIVLSLLVLIPFGSAWIAQQNEIQQALRQLRYFRGEEALRPALQARLDLLRKQEAMSSDYVVAPSAALAQAAIEHDLQTIAKAIDVQIRSTQAVKPGKSGLLESIGVHYELTVPATHLKAFLYAIETNKPYLFIDEIDIAAPVSWRASSTTNEAGLAMRLTLHAYWLGPQ